MVTVDDLKSDQASVKDELKKAIAANKQLGSQHKHAGYRLKREAELQIIKNRFERNDQLIIDNSTTTDNAYVTLSDEVEVLLEEYKQLLEQIPLSTGNAGGSGGNAGGSNSNNSGNAGGNTGNAGGSNSNNSGNAGGNTGGSGGNAGGGNNDNSGNSGGNSGGTNNSNNQSEKDTHERLMKSQQVRFDSFLKICSQILTRQDTGEYVSKSFGKIKIALINSSWERIAAGHEILGSSGDYTPGYLVQMNKYEKAMEDSLLFLQEIMDVTTDKTEGVKLERVTIPKFNGDYFKWVTFRDLFVSLVVDNTKLSKATKLQMLKTNVTGEPEYLISDLTISDVNFDAAWNRLKHRYENRRVIVTQHINKLMTQSPGKWESKSLKRLLDTTDQILLALKNLGRPIESWDDWIVFVITQKFTEDCRKDWEKRIGASVDLPTWIELKQFLEEEFRMLEGVENTQKKPQQTQQAIPSTSKNPMKVYQTTINTKGCAACGQNHKLFTCVEFRKMKPPARWELAKKSKLCFICLKPNHDKTNCTAQLKCKHCTRPHSTWLHDDRRDKQKDVSVNVVTKGNESKKDTNMVVASATVNETSDKNTIVTLLTTAKQVLLATALIITNDVNGRNIKLRALIDSGSQGSLITAKAADLLQLVLYNTKNEVAALGGGIKTCSKTLTLNIRPHFDSKFECETEFFVMPKLTRTLPDEDININDWNHIKGLQLADPKFNKVGPIDMLLGAEVVSEIMKEGLIKGNTGYPMAQQTELGWIVSGKIDLTYQNKRINCMLTTVAYDQNDLRQFWELEDLNPRRILTMDEELCEQMYQTTVRRNSDGTFTVRIPFKSDDEGPERLGTSKRQCLARFHQLEKKLHQNPKLKADYVQVMNEYIRMGHMKCISNKELVPRKYYIPHHAVIKPDSLTTKTRVVFDASAKTSSGWSLNECMHTGAKQQKDLLETLVKWRKHRIAFKADITKMYRMIRLDEQDQAYHTILWREDPTKELLEYQLTTVTFGTAAAPFLAMRTLKQLALDEGKEYPVAAAIVQDDFYVDDLISGCHTSEEAITIKEEILRLLAKGGFELRKWTSNSQDLLKSLEPELTEKSLQTFKGDDMTKALGLQWNPQTDLFNFHISWNVEESVITKRKLFSEASKLFDPLGWIAPVILNAKLYMQEIWMEKTDWDTEVSPAIQEKWTQLRNEIPLLEQIQVPRWIQYSEGVEIQLHGFCDASEKAYSAVVYTRIQDGKEVHIRMIASKTRVAPINSKTTLPRLELCAAVLLSNLLKTVSEALQIENVPITAWSDSMITLGWLKGHPSKWKTFVANRVSEAQDTKINDWRHIKSADNPADCASRGLMPADLKDHKLWWEGPEWLKDQPEKWPTNEIIEHEDEDPERKAIAVNMMTIAPNELAENTSSWFKLIRLTAYCLRMKKRAPRTSTLTTLELKQAEETLIRQCQREYFPDEMDKLIHNRPLLKSSRLQQLDPFLDENEIIRVGGRLQQSPITYDNRHPVILPPDHKITTLITQQLHKDTLHGGPQLMLGLLRKKYWVLNAKRKVTGEVRRCVICRRMSAQTQNQQMGILPKHRVSLVRPFLHTGVDYCGPFDIKSSTLRNSKLQKAYIAVFVCFGTKAFHLEMISDQTAEAFLAAFNRFIARRGLCETMYSDNGGNFTKGASILQQQQKLWLQQRSEEIKIVLSQKGIEWKFIPPESPNMGGLWERGVRSVKHHLKRTLQNTRLTFEEYNTVLCQIEACLNSRPLCPLTNDKETLNVLTPGHFLIGDALMAPPQQMLPENRFNTINRWRHLQLLHQHFWKRWHQEYLHQLQERQKWKVGVANLKIGDVVLLKDEDLPPRRWLMGQIENTFPGPDNKVRVVSVRTHTNGDPKTRKVITLKRSVRNLCLLLEENSSPKETAKPTAVKIEPTTSKINQQSEQQVVRTKQEVQLKANFPKFENMTKLVKKGKISKHQTPKRGGYTLRSRKINLVTMVLALVACAMLFGGSLADQPPMKNIEFKQNSGLYFENIGRGQVTRSNWHIYIHFDLARYYTEFKRLKDVASTFQQTCMKMNKIETDDHCKEISGLMWDKINEIKHWNELITANGEISPHQERRRSKRAAPLNVVGWVQHQLFGVMANEQAENIENQIQLAKENRDHLLNLLKNQTTIVENTANVIKRTHEEINEGYSKIDKILTQMQNESSDIQKKEKLLGLALYTALLMNRFETTQQTILDLITDVQKGHLSYHAFTPQQLKEQLVTINNHLPSGCKLFEDGQHDIKSVYRVMHCTTRVTNKNLLIHLSIPLVAIMDYQIYHVIPIPTKYQGNYVSIIPESDYLMITLKKDNFYQISAKELDTCVKPGDGAIVCNLKQPLYNAQSGKSLCERDLLEQKMEFSSACKFNVTKSHDFWFPLQRTNHWIYSLKKKVQVNIVCEQKIHTIGLENAGIIELGSGCEAVQPGMTITAKADKTSEGNFKFIPTLDLSTNIVTSGERKLHLINTTIDHAEQFNLIHDQVQELHEQSRLNEVHHTTHHGMNIMIWATIITMSLIIWFKRQQIAKTFTEWRDQPTSATATSDEQRKANKEDGRPKKPISDDIEISIARQSLRSSTVGRRHAGENVQSNIRI